MNTNLVTIADVFAGQAGMVPAVSRPEPTGKSPHVSNVGDEKRPQTNTGQPATPDNEHVNVQREPSEKAPKEFRLTLREKEESGLPKTQSNKKPEERDAGSKTAARPEIVQSWLAQHSVPVENNNQGATKIDPKSGPKLAELFIGLKSEKAMPVTGNAAKSTEVKLLDKTDKVQAGLKTVLPEKSQGLNGLKNVPADPSKGISVKQMVSEPTKVTGKTSSSEDVIAAKAPADKVQVGKAVVDVPGSVDGKSAEAGKKPVVADILPVGDTAKTVASKGKDSAAAAHTENGVKAAAPHIKTPVVGAGTVVEPAKSPQTPPAPTVIEPARPARAAEAETVVRISGFEKTKEASPSQRKGPKNGAGDAVSDSSSRKSGTAEVQVDVGQMKERGAGGSNSNSYQDMAQVVSQNGPETQTIAGSPSTFGAGAKSSDLPGGSSGDTSTDIGKQILESINSSLSQQSAEKQVTIRLNPPELGHVFVKLREQDAQINGVLEVSKAQTRLEIEQALPEITRNLAANGIQINRIEVVLSVPEQSAEHGARDALQHDGFFQQQGSQDNGSTENYHETADAYFGLTNDSPYRDIGELREMLVSDNAINVLI